MFVVVLTDVIFEVDDGHVAAHKVLLMAGCEMMNAMFSNSFLESSADVVSSSSPPSPPASTDLLWAFRDVAIPLPLSCCARCPPKCLNAEYMLHVEC